MRTRPAPRTFRSGELAPWLDGITNELTQAGCRTLENFIVRKQGQIPRRPGTFFVNEVKDSANATVLVPVTIDDDSSYVLELGDEYIRFYKNHARITYAGTTTIYEVTSPWSTGDVSDLRWAYAAKDKALLFFHNKYAIRKLGWAADASWSLGLNNIIASPQIIAADETGKLLKSIDGTKWILDRVNIPFSSAAKVLDIGFGGNYYAIISGDTGVKALAVADHNADTWIDNTPADLTFPYGVAGNEAGEFVAVGRTSGCIYSTEDKAVTWTKRTSTTVTAIWYGAHYSEDYNSWRISGQNASAYSKDGITWVSIADASWSDYIYRLGYGNGTWVGVGEMAQSAVSYGVIAYASSLTAAWITGYSLAPNVFYGLCHGEPSGSTLWLAVGAAGAIRTSPTGTIWTSVVPFTAKNLYATIWAKNKYYVFGDGPDYWVSENGSSFVSHTFIASVSSLTIRAANVSDYSEYEWFNQSGTFAGVGCFHEGRLVLSRQLDNPQRMWGSKVNEFNHFYLGEFANDAWTYDVNADRNADIQWLVGGLGGLVIGTRTAEGIMLGSQEEGITPKTAQFRWLSTFGSANIQPVRVNNAIVFVQRGGEIVRGYVPQANAYESPELTFFADHIGKGGLLSIDRQEDPQNIVYFVRSDGQIPALTMETGLIAWSRIKPASTSLSVGIVESIAVIPTGGAEDEVWQVVNRKVSAGTKRYIEYYDSLAVSSLADAHYVDCGVNPTSTVTFANVGALTHLAGEVVDALIDGTRWVAGLAVPASGTIALAPYSGTNIHAGLPYRSYMQTMRGDYGSPWGDGAGLNKRTNDLLVWIHDSSALATFGPTTTLATETIAYPSSTTLVTDVVKVNFPGQWDRDNYIWCIITDPRPFTLVAMAPDSETGDR